MTGGSGSVSCNIVPQLKHNNNNNKAPKSRIEIGIKKSKTEKNLFSRYGKKYFYLLSFQW